MPAALDISREAGAKTRQSLFLALIYKLIGMSCRLWAAQPGTRWSGRGAVWCQRGEQFFTGLKLKA